MRFKTASLAMLVAALLPISSPFAMRIAGVDGHAPVIPIALSPTTEVTMTFDAWRFDGSWTVVVFCPQSDGAPASAFRFMAGVKDGVLHGERGNGSSRGSMTLDGTIQPDGVARLRASGITNDGDEVLGVTPRDTSYVYEVAARFEGSRGLGARVEGRLCHLNFTRQ
jgi:hypothetical protein